MGSGVLSFMVLGLAVLWSPGLGVLRSLGFRVFTLEHCIVVFRVLGSEGFKDVGSHDPKL